MASPVISLAGGSSVYVDPNVTLTIGLTIGDPQTGATALAKTGSGTLVLSGSNTYSGGTTVSGGTLEITNAGNLGSGSLSDRRAILEIAGSFSDRAETSTSRQADRRSRSIPRLPIATVERCRGPAA